jgi:hypothetical protein
MKSRGTTESSENMSDKKRADFSKKHGDIQLNPVIEAEILKKAKNGDVPRAVLFDLGVSLKVTAKEIGMNLDLMNFRITKCQLGLFGYHPEKKIVTPAETVSGDLLAEIQKELANGRLPCMAAWEIAVRLKLHKMDVSRACESIGIRIKPCQLGAF